MPVNLFRLINFGILLFASLTACAHTGSPSKAPLWTSNPPQALLKLLALTHVTHDGTWKSILAATQKQWLRPAGKERWETEDKYADLRNEILPLLDKLGLFEQRTALNTHYRYAVIHGATAERFRNRLGYLAKEWNRGIRFDEIVVLTGDRLLDPKIESPEIQSNAKTERDMCELVFSNSMLPVEWSNLTKTFVDARSAISGNRPNTGDTAKAWLEKKTEPGAILAVSNQPYVDYQDLAFRPFLQKGFSLETIGDAEALKKDNISVYLDTIARQIYQLVFVLGLT